MGKVGMLLFVTKATPCSTGGIKKLIARGKVDKKKLLGILEVVCRPHN